jgi:capsular exopolysaccharide synthesis family protein
LVIGLILGTLVAFIAETFDTSLGAIDEVEETLGTPVLGVIPQADSKEITEKIKGGDGVPLDQKVYMVPHYAPKSVLAESFRALRLNLQSGDPGRKLRTIVVTSATPEEGKTVVATNLATAMAQAGLRTLLVEADLRKPTMSKMLGLDSSQGLSEILAGRIEWSQARKTISDMIVGDMGVEDATMTPGLDNLHIITSGRIPPNPAELIDSKRLLEFIQAAKKHYHVVVIDTPRFFPPPTPPPWAASPMGCSWCTALGPSAGGCSSARATS